MDCLKGGPVYNKMSLYQSVVNYLYRYPKGAWKQLQRNGGLVNSLTIARAKADMQKASLALDLSGIIKPSVNTSHLYFLTGKKYWYQTAFCLKSLLLTTQNEVSSTIVDDGTMDEFWVNKIKHHCPNIGIERHLNVEERLNKDLPESRYPFLRKKRLVYPHLKKLTDIHVGKTGYKMVLDSDMLFYREPNAVLEWLKKPTKPFHLVDVVSSYGYSQSLMESLCGKPIPERINVGLIGLNSAAIDWEKVEYWGKNLEAKEGTSYFLEQALTAMIIGDSEAVVGPADQYIVMPNKEEVFHPTAVLHHYVDISKEWYFKHAWRRFIQ